MDIWRFAASVVPAGLYVRLVTGPPGLIVPTDLPSVKFRSEMRGSAVATASVAPFFDSVTAVGLSVTSMVRSTVPLLIVTTRSFLSAAPTTTCVALGETASAVSGSAQMAVARW